LFEYYASSILYEDNILSSVAVVYLQQHDSCNPGRVNSDAWITLCNKALNAADVSLQNLAASASFKMTSEKCFWLFCTCWVHIFTEQRHFTKHMWTGMLYSKCSWTEKFVIYI